MTGEAESIGELSRTLAALKDDIRDDFAAVNRRLDSLNMVHADVYAADRHADALRHQALVEKIEQVEAAQEKAAERLATNTRLFVGSLLFPFILALIFYAVGAR